MDLFKEYKYLADKINTKMKSFNDNELGEKYIDFMERTLSNVDARLAREDIDIRTKSGNLTKSKKVFDNIPKRIQKALIKQLKNMHTHKIYGTVNKFKLEQELIFARNVETFKRVAGDDAWNEFCDMFGEDKASWLITKRMDEIRKREGKQYKSNQLILVAMDSYIPDSVAIKQAMAELEVEHLEMERLDEPVDWGDSFYIKKL